MFFIWEMPFLNFGSNKNKYQGGCQAASGYAPDTGVGWVPFLSLKLQKSDLRNRIKADALDALLLLKANSDHIDKLA